MFKNVIIGILIFLCLIFLLTISSSFRSGYNHCEKEWTEEVKNLGVECENVLRKVGNELLTSRQNTADKLKKCLNNKY